MPQDVKFQMRVNEELMEALNDWRRKQPDIPSRTEAIRRLVLRGIEADAKAEAEAAAPKRRKI